MSTRLGRCQVRDQHRRLRQPCLPEWRTLQGQDGRLQLLLCIRMARPVLPGAPSTTTLPKNTLRGPLFTLPTWRTLQQPYHRTSILPLPTRLFRGVL